MDNAYIVLVDLDFGDGGDTFPLAVCDDENSATALSKRLQKVIGRFSQHRKVYDDAVWSRRDAVRAAKGVREDRPTPKAVADTVAEEMRAIGTRALEQAGLTDPIAQRLIVEGMENMTLRTVTVPRITN